MVPGLAVEEFSTPPSSPVLATRTLSTIIPDSDDSNTATPSQTDLRDTPQQLRESPKSIITIVLIYLYNFCRAGVT